MSYWRFMNEIGDVAYNLAVSEVLLRSVGNERASNTLRIAYCNPSSVILGIQHIPQKVINIQEIRALKFNIGRRPTSGPILFFTDKQMAVQFFLKDNRPTSDSMKRKIIDIMINALRELNINASYEEPYSLYVNKRMLAYVDVFRINHALGITFYFNVDNDEEYRKRVLTINSLPYATPSYFTSLKYELGQEYSPSTFIETIKSVMKRELGISFTNQRLTDYEAMLLKSHIEKHTMSEWIYEYRNKNINASSDVKAVTIDTKTGFITVLASTDRGLIMNIHISGDFYIYPPEALEALEAGLKFAPADESYIEEYVKRYIKVGKVELYGIDEEEIVEAIRRATIP
jgi:lipoate-protein ligase A